MKKLNRINNGKEHISSRTFFWATKTQNPSSVRWVISILNNKGVPFHYTIIASGKDNENIHYQIHDLGLDEYINFINGLSHGDVIEKLSESDLFLLPSVGEGISNAVLEAMALGLPVISTDCGGMSEVIIDNKTGFLVPTRDPEAMARTIIKFCSLDEKEKTKLAHYEIIPLYNHRKIHIGDIKAEIKN